MKQFQTQKHQHLLEIDRIECELGRLLERKAMTVEEIRARLMMRADMVSQLEEYEYQLESAADDLSLDANSKDHLESLFRQLIDLRRSYMEIVRKQLLVKSMLSMTEIKD